jgi:hypothetical protein
MDYDLGNITKDLFIIILAAIILGFLMHIEEKRRKKNKEKDERDW